MPTAAERLATLEALGVQLQDDLRAVHDLIDGGGGVTWERSMRGRLHKIESDVNALLQLRRAGIQLTTRTGRSILYVIALAVAAAPYVLYFLPTHP